MAARPKSSTHVGWRLRPGGHTLRRPGESRDPATFVRCRGSHWIPAFSGTMNVWLVPWVLGSVLAPCLFTQFQRAHVADRRALVHPHTRNAPACATLRPLFLLPDFPDECPARDQPDPLVFDHFPHRTVG